VADAPSIYEWIGGTEAIALGEKGQQVKSEGSY